MTSRCNQARTQMCLLRIFCAVWCEMPNRLARILEPPSPFAFAARISRTMSAVSFFPRLGVTAPSSRPPLTAWRWFSLRPHHSKLVQALLSFRKSRWFTSADLCGGSPTNAPATRRWTFLVSATLAFDKWTCRYPFRSGVCRSTRPPLTAVLYRFLTTRGRLRTLPKELTSYKPSYPAIGSHLSIGWCS
jgi:hypothetical protein